MARAKRHYIPGHVWHIAHRCHKREFLLKFPRDRCRWIEWLYQAKKRYSGLSVLNYAHDKWVNSAMQTDNRGEENKWTPSIAVGSKTLVEKMKEALGFRAKGRKIICADDTFELREMLTPYGKANNQDSGNTILWDQPPPPLISQFLHEN